MLSTVQMHLSETKMIKNERSRGVWGGGVVSWCLHRDFLRLHTLKGKKHFIEWKIQSRNFNASLLHPVGILRLKNLS